MSSNLNERQQLAVVLLCSGLSATEVAKELKVRKETISRWKNDRDFNEELRSWRLAFFDRLIKRQFSLFSEAQHQTDVFLVSTPKPNNDAREMDGMWLLATKPIGKFSLSKHLMHCC
jgi:hypothetical protein